MKGMAGRARVAGVYRADTPRDCRDRRVAPTGRGGRSGVTTHRTLCDVLLVEKMWWYRVTRTL